MYKFVLFLIGFQILTSKLFFNAEADPTSGFNESAQNYMSAVQLIALLLPIILLNAKRITNIPRNPLVIASLAYYASALLFSPFSQIAIISSYRASQGLMFVLIALIVFRLIEEHPEEQRMNKFIQFLLTIFLTGIFGNVLFWTTYYGLDVFIDGLPSGYIAFIDSFIAIMFFCRWLDAKNPRNLVLAILAGLVCLKLNSFSALMSLAVGLVAALLIYRKRVLVAISAALIGFAGFSFYQFLVENPETVIGNKTAYSYLIGSGRFMVYEATWDAYGQLPFLEKLIGIGFMAERSLLANYDLPWVTQSHNSFLVSIMGIGFIGVFWHIVFVFAPLFLYKRLASSVPRLHLAYFYCFHVMAVFWGITSSDYLGSATYLVVIGIVLLLTTQSVTNSQTRPLDAANAA